MKKKKISDLFGDFFHFFIRFKCNSVSKCFKTYFYHKLNQKNEKKYFQKKSEIFFFSFDLYIYIVLKHLNKI